MTGPEYKALREKLGLTQAGLAALLGVTRKTINARENGAKITEEARLAILSLSSPNTQEVAGEALPPSICSASSESPSN
jgi:DNA-binding XRE family transcriptional regulator